VCVWLQSLTAGYGTRQDAQRLLNQKHMGEIETALQEALRKADALWSEMEEEQRLNRTLRELVVKLRTNKLEVEDRIEEYAPARIHSELNLSTKLH